MTYLLIINSIISSFFFSTFYYSATVTNLQAKVESLTTTNALMKEDLAIAKNSLLALYEENRSLKNELGKGNVPEKLNEGVRITNATETDLENSKTAAGEIAELKQRLEEERRLRQEADKELQLQVSKISYILRVIFYTLFMFG